MSSVYLAKLTGTYFKIVLIASILPNMLTYRCICAVRIHRSGTIKYVGPSITTDNNKRITPIIENVPNGYTGYETKPCNLLP